MASLDFEKEKSQFKEFYSTNQTQLESAKNSFCSLIKALLENADIHFTKIEGRVKDKEECIKVKHKDLKTRLTNHLVSHSKMERGLRATINPIDDGCNIDINIIVDKDFSKQDQELLNELNKIIINIDNSYLWRELSEFDLKLRERFKKEVL